MNPDDKTTCCDRNCAANGWVCVSADATAPAPTSSPEPTPPARLDAARAAIAPMVELADAHGGIANLLGGVLQDVGGGEGALALGEAFVRALMSISDVVAHANRRQVDADHVAQLLHDFAAQLDAHDASADRALAHKFDTSDAPPSTPSA